MDHKNKQIVIVGAGITGAAAALYLAQHHVSVKIIEQNWTTPERIVGELLQPGGYLALKALGLSEYVAEIDAQAIYGYVLQSKSSSVVLNYDAATSNPEIHGLGFKNEKFLANLRIALTHHPLIECIEGKVERLHEENHTIKGVYYRDTKNKIQFLPSSLCIAADGMFSALRKDLSRASHQVSSFFVGLLLEDISLPLPDYGYVFTGAKSPVLAYPVGSRQVRILADYPNSTPPHRGESLNRFLNEVVGHQLPDSMKNSWNSALQKGKLKFMPNHRLHAAPIKKGGVVLIGDALNMRHPLTGGGMTVAFSDILHLVKSLVPTFCKEASSANFDNILNERIQHFYATRHQYVAGINILADALYQVFNHPQLKDACVAYLSKGEKYAQAPLQLLSGLSQDTSVLMRHFFGVAWLGAQKQWTINLKAQPIKKTYSTLKDAVKIVSPLYADEIPDSNFSSALFLANKILP